MQRTVLLGTLFFALSSYALKAQTDWEERLNKDSIKVYTRNLPNKKFLEVKASTTITASLHSLIALIKSVDDMSSWMVNFTANELLETKGFWQQISYHEVHVPILQNRDVILEVSVKENQQDNSLLIDMHALPDYLPETKNKSRIKELKGSWYCQAQGNGRIYVEYSLYLDPGKNIPSWLYNSRIKNDPYNTLRNIKEMVKKEDFKQARYVELSVQDQD
jgi:hypothetical protein